VIIIITSNHGTVMLWTADTQINYNNSYYKASETCEYRFSFDPFFFFEEMPNPLVLCGAAKLRDDDLNFLPYASNIKDLTFKDCDLLTDRTLALLPTSITSLKLINCKNFTDEGLTNLSFLPKLKKLTITECPEIQGKTLSSLPLSVAYLSINRCNNFLDEGIASLSFLTKLKTISFVDCVQLTGSTLDLLPPYVQSLTIKKCPWITDMSVRNLFLLSKLTSLNLSYCPRIVGGTLGYLPKSLEKLDLKGCTYLMCVETLIPLTRLNFLDVSLTPITDLYLPFLEKLQINEIVIGPCKELYAPEELSYYKSD
jgi:F-box and leucine-rich repeat protein 14